MTPLENIEKMAADSGLIHILNDLLDKNKYELNNIGDVFEEYTAKKIGLLKLVEESKKQTNKDVLSNMTLCEEVLRLIDILVPQVHETSALYDHHSQSVTTTSIHFDSLSANVLCSRNKQVYLSWLQETNNICNAIENCLEKKAYTNAVVHYNKLCGICQRLHATTCTNIKQYLLSTTAIYQEKLKGVFTVDLNNVLTSIKYPFSTGIDSPMFNKKRGNKEQLSLILTSIVKLQSPDFYSDVSLVTELLVEPLKKRFQYHFYGEKHTNDPDKPEWFLTQVSNWIKDHTHFLDTFVQPLVEKNSVQQYNVNREFACALRKMCAHKLSYAFEESLGNSNRLAHLIDEILLFEKGLQFNAVDYSTRDECLRVLLSNKNLRHWLDLERKFLFDVMRDILACGAEGWERKFHDITSGNKSAVCFVPRCVEEFMTIVTVACDRHKTLHNECAEGKFFILLTEVFEAFIAELEDIAALAVLRPESRQFCSLLNGVYYVMFVLQEWSVDLRFIRLHEYNSLNGCQSNNEDGVFSNLLTSLRKFIEVLLESIVESMEHSFREKAKVYQSERWHYYPSTKDYLVTVLSTSACDILLHVKDRLYTLENQLCEEVFKTAWKKMAEMIDRILFVYVVFETRFNEDGAFQLKFDVTKNLFNLFGSYTKRPECYFKLLNDSCNLLTILPGTAVLLKGMFQQANRSGSDKEEFLKRSLQEIDVNYLSFSQAQRLLNARVDWGKIRQ